MSEETTATGGRGRKGKPKDLDLSASEVREVASEAPSSEVVDTATPEVCAPEAAVAEGGPAEAVAAAPPAAEEAPDGLPEAMPGSAPAAPSKLMPAALGLIAGLVGGLGGAILAPKISAPVGLMAPAAPVLDPALVERLGKAEAALNDAKGREEVLRAEIAALGQKLSGEAEAARKAVETVDAKAAKLAQPNPEIDSLKGRLGTLEGESKVLPREVSALGTRVGTLTPRLDTLEKTLDTLTGRIALVGSKDALALANGRLAAQALLEEEFSTGKPYAATLDLLARTGGEASLIALVKPFAETGAPSPVQLRTDFAALKPKSPAAKANEEGLMERAKKTALSLVEIRQVGQTTAQGDAGVLARMEASLAKGDLKGAMESSAALSASLAPTYAPWRARLEARIRAGEAVVQLRRDAQQALARAAASAK